MEKQRQMSERSLENLKLGAQARDQGKIRTNCTLLPETLEWLKKHGNASHLIDELVKAAKKGELKPAQENQKLPDVRADVERLERELLEVRSQLETAKYEADSNLQNATQWKNVADLANEEAGKLREENAQTQSQLDSVRLEKDEWCGKAKEAHKLAEDRLRKIDGLRYETQPVSLPVNLEAISLLQEALKLPANTGGKIKEKIRAALDIIN